MTTHDSGDQYTATRERLDALKRRFEDEGFDFDRSKPLVIDRKTFVSANQEWTCADLLTVASIFEHAAVKTHELPGRGGEFTDLAIMFLDAYDGQCPEP
jgi:hypothetical protein